MMATQKQRAYSVPDLPTHCQTEKIAYRSPVKQGESLVTAILPSTQKKVENIVKCACRKSASKSFKKNHRFTLREIKNIIIYQ